MPFAAEIQNIRVIAADVIFTTGYIGFVPARLPILVLLLSISSLRVPFLSFTFVYRIGLGIKFEKKKRISGRYMVQRFR